MEASRSKSILTGILTVVVIAAIAFILVLLLNNTKTPTNNNVESKSELQTYCEANNGTWIEESEECEGISEVMCVNKGGVFNECASACRNNPEQEVCTLQCVQVCEFGVDQSTELTSLVTVQVYLMDEPAVFTQVPQENENAFDFMTRLAETNPQFSFEYSDSSFGKFVTAVNGVVADSTSEFWELSVNGTPAAVGISDLVLAKGDVVDWKLVTFTSEI